MQKKCNLSLILCGALCAKNLHFCSSCHFFKQIVIVQKLVPEALLLHHSASFLNLYPTMLCLKQHANRHTGFLFLVFACELFSSAVSKCPVGPGAHAEICVSPVVWDFKNLIYTMGNHSAATAYKAKQTKL